MNLWKKEGLRLNIYMFVFIQIIVAASNVAFAVYSFPSFLALLRLVMRTTSALTTMKATFRLLAIIVRLFL